MKKKDDFVTFSVINNERCFVFCRVTSFLNECVRERERERERENGNKSERDIERQRMREEEDLF